MLASHLRSCCWVQLYRISPAGGVRLTHVRDLGETNQTFAIRSHHSLTTVEANIASTRYKCLRLSTLAPFLRSKANIAHMMTSSSASVSDEQFDKILQENSTQRYYIEYEGFLSNHLSHAQVALHKLGASTGIIEDFTEWYKENLENPDDFAQENKLEISETVGELLGKRKSYYVILSHYKDILKKKYESDLERLVTNEFPKFSDGLIGSAFHGLIHTGYGLAAQKDWFVCEGLAYLHHSYLPLKFSASAPSGDTLGKGDTEILDAVDVVHNDHDLREFMTREAETLVWENSVARGFQRSAMVLVTFKADELADYVHKIKFPDFYNPDSMDQIQKVKLAKWIVDCALIVFCLSSRRNDFFLLHGVTAAWSLSNILPLLGNHDVIKATRAFLCGLLAAYLAQNAPELDRSRLRCTESDDVTWQDIIDQALTFRSAEFDDGREEDEHVYKLVQVCREMSSANTDPTMEPIYKMAAHSITCHPLNFG